MDLEIRTSKNALYSDMSVDGQNVMHRIFSRAEAVTLTALGMQLH
jgi:hypothetical protein